MIVVTCEVREVTEAGSRLVASATDVPNAGELVSFTLMRVAGQAGIAHEEADRR